MTTERGTETSRSLTEIRTVLSRAQTAYHDIARGNQAGFDYERDVPLWEPDEDQAEMLAALDAFIASASHWARRGRKMYT